MFAEWIVEENVFKYKNLKFRACKNMKWVNILSISILDQQHDNVWHTKFLFS